MKRNILAILAPIFCFSSIHAMQQQPSCFGCQHYAFLATNELKHDSMHVSPNSDLRESDGFYRNGVGRICQFGTNGHQENTSSEISRIDYLKKELTLLARGISSIKLDLMVRWIKRGALFGLIGGGIAGAFKQNHISASIGGAMLGIFVGSIIGWHYGRRKLSKIPVGNALQQIHTMFPAFKKEKNKSTLRRDYPFSDELPPVLCVLLHHQKALNQEKIDHNTAQQLRNHLNELEHPEHHDISEALHIVDCMENKLTD